MDHASTIQEKRLPSAGHDIPFREAVGVWAKIAALSFGGPAGQIAVMHRILVEEKRWIGEDRFLHALNYCMLLPGPEAQQLAMYIGWLLHRTLGGLVAGTLFVLPGFVAILALSLALRRPRRRAGGRGALLRPQGGGAGDRARSGRAHRPAGAEERRDGGDRGRGLRRHLLLRRALPADHLDGRADRPGWRQGGVRGLQRRRPFRARDRHDVRCRIGAGRRDAGACPPRSRLVAQGGARSACCSGSVPFSRCSLTLGERRRVHPDRGLLQQDGRGHVRRRLRRARLRRAARRSRSTAGSSRARCSTASAWPRRRPAR